MPAHIFRLTIVEGETANILLQVRGPEGTWIRGDTASGSQGVTSVTRRIFEKTNDATPSTLVATTTLTNATVMPYTGGASGPGILGDGWSDEPEGYNFRDLVAPSVYSPEGGHVYLFEYTIALTGSTGGQAWGSQVILVEVSVVSTYAT